MLFSSIFHDVELPLEHSPDMFLLPCLLTYSQLLIYCKLAIKSGVEQPLIQCVHQLSGRTELMRVLLQHSVFDRTVNNRLIALHDYLYQQQHKSHCRWNWEVKCLDNDKLSLFHRRMKKQ